MSRSRGTFLRRFGVAAVTVISTITAAPAQGTATSDPGAPDPSRATLSLPPAATMMGTKLGAVPVYGPAGETIGDVEDTVLGFDGRVVAYVIGLGGTLGLGEKLVAVREEHVSVERSDEGELRFTVDLPLQTLERAPKFRKPD